MIEINEKTMAASPTHKVTRNTKKNYVRNVIFRTWNILYGQKHTSSKTNNQPRVFSKQRWPMPSLGMFNFQQLDLEMNMSNMYQQKIKKIVPMNWPSQVNFIDFQHPQNLQTSPS